MHWPPPEGTTFLIMVSPVPGKLTRSCKFPTYIVRPVRFDCGFRILRNAGVICVCQLVLWVLVIKNFPFYNSYLFAGHEQILLARQDELRLASLLAELQQLPVFNVQQFEAAIDSIRTCVAEVKKALPHLVATICCL